MLHEYKQYRQPKKPNLLQTIHKAIKRISNSCTSSPRVAIEVVVEKATSTRAAEEGLSIPKIILSLKVISIHKLFTLYNLYVFRSAIFRIAFYTFINR